MDTWEPTLSTGPLLGIAVIAVAVILVMVIRFKIHAFITLISVSALTALAAGIPFELVVPTMTEGFGKTLASVAGWWKTPAVRSPSRMLSSAGLVRSGPL